MGNADFNGSDSFVVQVSDGALTDTITVNVTVSGVSDAPVITSFDGNATSGVSVHCLSSLAAFLSHTGAVCTRGSRVHTGGLCTGRPL